MKLSEQLYRDFLAEAYLDNKLTRSYQMSYDYLIDLILKIQELEKNDRNNTSRT